MFDVFTAVSHHDSTAWSLVICRDIDTFVENLQSTLNFFANLESSSDNAEGESFVPFV